MGQREKLFSAPLLGSGLITPSPTSFFFLFLGKYASLPSCNLFLSIRSRSWISLRCTISASKRKFWKSIWKCWRPINYGFVNLFQSFISLLIEFFSILISFNTAYPTLKKKPYWSQLTKKCNFLLLFSCKWMIFNSILQNKRRTSC